MVKARCRACDKPIMLCADGWEHLNSNGRPIGTWSTRPGPQGSGRVGHPASPRPDDMPSVEAQLAAYARKAH